MIYAFALSLYPFGLPLSKCDYASDGYEIKFPSPVVAVFLRSLSHMARDIGTWMYSGRMRGEKVAGGPEKLLGGRETKIKIPPKRNPLI